MPCNNTHFFIRHSHSPVITNYLLASLTATQLVLKSAFTKSKHEIFFSHSLYFYSNCLYLSQNTKYREEGM